MVRINTLSKMVKKVDIKVFLFLFICLGLGVYYYNNEMKTERFRDKRIGPMVPGTKIYNNPKCSDNRPKPTNKAQCVSWDYTCDPADRKVESLTTKCKNLLNKRITRKFISVKPINGYIDKPTDEAIYKAYNIFNNPKYKNKRIQVILKYPKGRFTFNYKLTDNISLGFLKKITQKKGNFDFGNQFFSETHDCKKLQSLIILGEGSENTIFVTTDSNIHAINGSGITGKIMFKGITFSRDHLSSSQGKITNNDFNDTTSRSDLTIKIEQGFPSIKELLERKEETIKHIESSKIINDSNCKQLSIKLYTGKGFKQGNFIHKYNPDGIKDKKSMGQAKIFNVEDLLNSNSDKVIIKVAAENKKSWKKGDNIAIKIKSGGFPYYLWGENGEISFVDIKWTHKTRGIIRGRWDRVYMDRIHIPNTSVNNIRPYIASSGGGPQIGGETDGYKCDFVKKFELKNSSIMNSGDDNLGLFHIQNCTIDNIVTNNAFGRNILFHHTSKCKMSNITTDLEGRFEYNYKNEKGINDLLNDGNKKCIDIDVVLKNVPKSLRKEYKPGIIKTDIVQNPIQIPLFMKSEAVRNTTYEYKLFDPRTTNGQNQQKSFKDSNIRYKDRNKKSIKKCNGNPEYSYCNHLKVGQCDLPGQKVYCPVTCGICDES